MTDISQAGFPSWLFVLAAVTPPTRHETSWAGSWIFGVVPRHTKEYTTIIGHVCEKAGIQRGRPFFGQGLDENETDEVLCFSRNFLILLQPRSARSNTKKRRIK